MSSDPFDPAESLPSEVRAWIVWDRHGRRRFVALAKPTRRGNTIEFCGWQVEHYPRGEGQRVAGYALLESECRVWCLPVSTTEFASMKPRMRLPTKVVRAINGGEA